MGQAQAQGPGVTVVTNGWVKPAVVNAKAGNAGVRPRPIKKQRVVGDRMFCTTEHVHSWDRMSGHARPGTRRALAAAHASRLMGVVHLAPASLPLSCMTPATANATHAIMTTRHIIH